MEFYAYHGCFEQERKIGTRFSVDIAFDTDSALVEKSDEVKDTVDYSMVYKCIKAQMEISSKTLENLARRTIEALRSEFPTIEKIVLTVKKLNPPVGGKMDCVSVTLTDDRD